MYYLTYFLNFVAAIFFGLFTSCPDTLDHVLSAIGVVGVDLFEEGDHEWAEDQITALVIVP